MQQTTIILENNRAAISGILNFKTVVALREEGEKLLSQQDGLEFDFSAVTKSDSAGLALLTAWFRSAQKKKKQITCTHLPQQLRDMARVSGLEKILALGN